MFLLSFLVACASWVVWCTVSFLKNLQTAKKLGFPIVISPVSTNNPLWIVLGPLCAPLLARFPGPIRKLAFYNTHDWMYIDQGRIHEEMGQVVMHVTPGLNQLLVGDAALCDYILSKKKGFIKPIPIDSINHFGKAVSTVEGAEWQRHRKITSPPFNERNSALVWKEAWRQADQMLSVWTENRKPVHSVFHDASRLTLNVITCAGFGLSYHFRAAQNSVKEGHSMSYGDALMSVMDNIVLLVLVPFWMLNLPMIPKALANFKTAICEFKDYMADMVDLAKKEAAKNGIVHPNLLNTLVQKSQEMVESKNVGASGLTDGEIYGNLFVFSFAGFETTASTLTYAIYLLAAYPKWQDWLVEEIQSVCGDLNLSDPPSYETLFPRLNRCLAAILETLRLFPVVLKIPKNTGDSPQNVTVKGRDYTIPADTDLLLNVVSLHLHSEYWGDDAQVWRPDRFIEKSAATSATVEDETLRIPTPGSFVPWADGPRNCPGKKFAQVELVAVIAKLLHGHKIEVERNLGETDEQARERVLSVTQDSEAILILHMRKSESVKLNFVKREIR